MRVDKLAILLCFSLGTIAGTAVAQTPPTQAKAPQVRPICANCHEDKWNAIDLTAHGAKTDANGSMCQACHGDATEHLKDPTKAKPANPFAQGHTGQRADRGLPHLPQRQPQPRVLDVRQAPAQRGDVRNCHSIHGQSAPSYTANLPQSDDQQVHDDVPAEPGGDLRHVPPAHPRGELQAVASPDHRRQGQVHRLPQPARRAHAGDAEAADDQRPVLLVPRRQARSVRVQPPAGRGELRDLPQPARLGPRTSS